MSDIQIIVTDDGSHSLYLPGLNETYHSSHGAMNESRHVFIKNGFLSVIAEITDRPIRVLEVGFGTGLNALLCLQKTNQLRIPVHYTTLEPYPLEETIYKELNYTQLLGGEEELREAFLKMHESTWDSPEAISQWFTLDKRRQKLEEFSETDPYHVVFFDAFAPNKQQEVWEAALLQKVARSMAPGGLLTTYCAQGQFKRNLKAAGLEVETLPGPPGKKEMTRGKKP